MNTRARPRAPPLAPSSLEESPIVLSQELREIVRALLLRICVGEATEKIPSVAGRTKRREEKRI
jgi:hypothetical protein